MLTDSMHPTVSRFNTGGKILGTVSFHAQETEKWPSLTHIPNVFTLGVWRFGISIWALNVSDMEVTVLVFGN